MELFILILILSNANSVFGSPVDDGVKSLENTVTEQEWLMFGKELLTMGRKLNKPSLAFIGMTVDYFHPCSEWTQWSACDASRIRFFGTKTRIRSCRHSRDMDGNFEQDTDSAMCFRCPENYNITEKGLCIGLYHDDDRLFWKNQVDAQKQCHSDGGHLVNVESESKHADVKILLKGRSFHAYPWIDGRRKDSSSGWEYSYGSSSGYLKWATKQPDNNPDHLCLIINAQGEMYDASCTGKRPFLCEVVL